mgnify:CR=1 FL=1
MEFEKWQGCGNDFVLIDRTGDASIDDLDVKLICDRHFGVGSDGLIVARLSKVADARMQMFNPDGSEAEMCGNGIRCFAKFLIERGLVDKKTIPIETGAGVLTVEIAGDDVIVDMGAPILEGDRIPVLGFDGRRIIDESIEIDGREFKMTCVSMGNPHCVVFVDKISGVDIKTIGPKFETNEKFPRRINTEFVEVIDRSTLRMRVWERGAGITLACGTGACATAVAGVLSGRSDRRAKIILDGGALELEWRESDGHVMMKGAARKVFAGRLTM